MASLHSFIAQQQQLLLDIADDVAT